MTPPSVPLTMAPSKGKKSKASATAPATGPATTPGESSTVPQTIGEIRRAEYLASRPYQVLFETKGWNGLSAEEKTAYTNFRLLESGAYERWTATEQKDFLKHCEKLKIPHPLPEPKGSVEFDVQEFEEEWRKIETLSLSEYRDYRRGQDEAFLLRCKSRRFKDRVWKIKQEAKREKEGEKAQKSEEHSARRPPTDPITEGDIQEEKKRRVKIAELEGRTMPGIYEGDPLWDDVVPIPQDDGERPLAAIAYTDEYAEAISYLRAVMAVKEYSPRVLDLTAHIIELNPAHYTVWLFRASTLFYLKSDLFAELKWVNQVALANQKNYQIWHHRQLLVDNIYPTFADDRTKVLDFARSESAFMAQMFALDSKNYHVWSYRQYFVRKLSLFPSQCTDPSELAAVEDLLDEDVRNNSAWAHRFFIVFSDPGHSTENSRALERDPKLPAKIVEREIDFSKTQIRRAPQNQSGWNYVRGVLRKGGRQLSSLDAFAREFVVLPGAGGGEVGSGGKEDVKSSHALELLVDIWTEQGELEKADGALRLLGEKYDRIRKNYWEYRRDELRGQEAAATVEALKISSP